MPMVRISVSSTTTAAQRRQIADAVYEAMRATIDTPEGDRFILVTPRGEDELFVDAHFMGMHRTAEFMLVQIFLARGRSAEKKQALFARIATDLHTAIGIATDDVMIVLNENDGVDWSFGKGEAPFATQAPNWVSQTGEKK